MTIERFYTAIQQAIKAYPVVSCKPCLSPSTFHVLEGISDFNAPNLGRTKCDKQSPYFYSKRWAETGYNPSVIAFDFPLVAVYEEGITYEHPMKTSTNVCYELALSVLDKKDLDCADCCGECKGRNGNQIFRDTEKMLLNILNYISSLKITVDDKFTTSDTFDSVKTARFLKSFKDNTSVSGSRFIHISNAGLYGSTIRLKICVQSCADEYLQWRNVQDDFTNPDFGCCS